MGPGPNERGLSRKRILDAVTASLRRLGTDHIDLYQLHVWDDGTSLDESLSTLDRRGAAVPVAGTRVESEADGGTVPWDGYATERTWRVIDEASTIATEIGR